MDNQLEIEALENLITAVRKYRDELETNKIILVNAANLCDQAMGSDAISQRHIAALNLSIAELEKTSQIVESVTEALVNDLNKAKDVMED
jgi:GTPase involved in cell partitioning and DNA repair